MTYHFVFKSALFAPLDKVLFLAYLTLNLHLHISQTWIGRNYEKV